jgi:large subunit ribosomal protein L10
MPTAEKARTIEQAKEWYGKSVGVVFTDYRGLTVKEIQGLRADLRKKGGEIHVIKNTLFRIAAGADTDNMPAELHNGTTAVAFVFENEAGCAKTLLDYARTSKKLVVKGGFFGGKAFTSKQVEALSELPPRDVLISQVIGAIAAPLSGLIGTIEALYADPIRAIGAVADKVAEGSPVEAKPTEAPAAAAAPEAAPETPAAEAALEAAPEATPEAEASTESAPAADAEPEAAEPAADAPAETSDDTNSTEASE